MKYTKLALNGLMVLASALSAGGAFGQDLREVNLVSSLRGVSFLPVYAAMEQGYFEEAGLKVNHVDVNTSSLVAAALTSGQADFGAMQPDVVISANAQGGTLKMLANLVAELPYKFIVRSDITRIEDFEGKKVGSVAPNNGNEIVARWILDENGLQDKVEYAPTGPQGSLVAALLAGQIDGAMLVSPWSVDAVKDGMVQLLDSADYLKGVSAAAITATDAKIAEDPELVRAFVGAVVEGAQWMVDNEAEAVALLAERVAMSPEDAQIAYDQGRRAMSPTGEINVEGIMTWMNVSFKYKGMEPNLTIQQLYDPSFLPGKN